jgi:hypothetical protein
MLFCLRRVPSAYQARAKHVPLAQFGNTFSGSTSSRAASRRTWFGSSSTDVRYIPELPLRTAASAIRNVLGFSTSRSTYRGITRGRCASPAILCNNTPNATLFDLFYALEHESAQCGRRRSAPARRFPR